MELSRVCIRANSKYIHYRALIASAIKYNRFICLWYSRYRLMIISLVKLNANNYYVFQITTGQNAAKDFIDSSISPRRGKKHRKESFRRKNRTLDLPKKTFYVELGFSNVFLISTCGCYTFPWSCFPPRVTRNEAKKLYFYFSKVTSRLPRSDQLFTGNRRKSV